MSVAILLGILQGVFEWLPVSSEGVVTAVYSLVHGGALDEGVEYALWLHIGTVPSALVVFRREVVAVVKDAAFNPFRPSPLTLFLVLSTGISAVVGLPLLLALGEISAWIGGAGMGVVGALMLATGAIQLRRKAISDRTISGLRKGDALLAGIAQGVSVLPGLSRSGLTIATLLGRGFDRSDALTLSFLMSIPAGLGAAAYVMADSGVTLSAENIVAAAVAFVTGVVAIKALLAFAVRINVGAFVMAVGFLMLIGSIVDIVF